MKKIYLFAGMVTMMIASCSTEEKSSGGYVVGSKVTLNASLPNSGTRVNEAASDTYGLITTWSDDDSLDVLVNTNTIVSMTKSTGNTFTATPADMTIASGFYSGKTLYGVNNKSNDSIITALNGSQLEATVNFSGQNGTVDNLKKYDLMYGKGDPTGNITFNHKICVLRLDINSSQLSTDAITSILGLKLKYVTTLSTKLFASKEVYNFGTTCDSTITDADSIYIQNANISVSSGKATVYIAVPNRQNLFGTLYIHLVGSNGTTYKSYDLTKAITLSNGRMLMSTVHPLAITGLSGVSNTTAKVGYYLYNDGSWGSVDDYILGAASVAKITPKAVIFSSTTSATDKARGWTRGYAMALNTVNSSTKYVWGPITTNPTRVLLTTSAAILADKDGYSHSTYINNSTYPAGFAAFTTYKLTVAAPTGTSGWYLPSSGQWYDICVNLGKLPPTGFMDGVNNLLWYNVVGTTTTCVNINTYLTPLTGSTIFSDSQVYWSSSEYDIKLAYLMGFRNTISLVSNDKASSLLVRPVIAF